jgi:hypothetical protein
MTLNAEASIYETAVMNCALIYSPLKKNSYIIMLVIFSSFSGVRRMGGGRFVTSYADIV